MLVAPAATGTAKATIRGSDIDGNACGVVAASFGPLTDFNFASNCGVNLDGTARAASVNTSRTSISNHTGSGVASIGSSAVNRIGRNDVFDNAIGLNAIGGGSILSYGSNHVDGNDVDGNPTGRVGTR